mmetsp:Transcript_15893/g.23379  ORF Transcript_15893/g.23379 Transcript_15893/m.23379 type:complete len:111 (+) Transcript_15893:111-443(+)|eukprot:CAMPEP_0194208354 /NCGR_PEP_ID=MMETSP0156-20130528/6830_1 /TAXON_ID=33649 /ORGANISM="Thalassionema nitzschioides, Strain L26-B" /LENGTH=110 /DNA_ID=CAMNT_0038935305 /DNA_START=111 /DNA_END=443 /DNA_ORIENTATION=-
MSNAVPPDVIAKYRGLMQECQKINSKIAELETDRNEHKLVEETLEPLDPDRRAFRLVGGVLVERTVKEVLPPVKKNRENLEQVISTMQQRLEVKQKDTSEIKAKYNLVNE